MSSSASQRVLAQGRYETGVLLRNGEQLLVSMVLPLLALLALAWTSVPSLGAGSRIDLAVPGVLALAVMSTAFTGQAIALAFDRRYGVLRLFGTTPLGTGGLVAGRALAVLAVIALQVVVLGAVGLALGWRPEPAGVLPALVVGVLGAAAFVVLAVLVGGRLRAEAVLAVANLLWVVFLALGSLLPSERFGDPWAQLVRLTPSGALGDGLRAALAHGQWDLGAMAVLGAWAVLGGVVATRIFRWSD
ncbi:ABC transporter permease [Kytococcus sedentarius]|uniref:ABC transporter permease n=1 Tax=Kytococcus sedentarius TaxID=1276 RepID=UPI0035BC341F